MTIFCLADQMTSFTTPAQELIYIIQEIKKEYFQDGTPEQIHAAKQADKAVKIISRKEAYTIPLSKNKKLSTMKDIMRSKILSMLNMKRKKSHDIKINFLTTHSKI